MIDGPLTYMPVGIAHSTMDILNPKKSVIVDMIMVQLLSLIFTFGLILLFNASGMNSNDVAYTVGGLFAATTLLGAIYNRLASQIR